MSKSFGSYRNTDPGWGTETRRAMCIAACKYLGIPMDTVGSDPSDSELVSTIKNGLGIAFHSVLHSPKITLQGSSLDKIKRDSALLKLQQKIITKIKKSPKYKKEEIEDGGTSSIQFGGQRARGEMWKQALGFWKKEYSATWEVALNELTWTVRSVNIFYRYIVTADGAITIKYSFIDTLDLRPDWVNRSNEYNAVCTVLGFLYHDIIGASDELEIEASWKTQIKEQ